MNPLKISLVEDNRPLAEELRELFDSQPDMQVDDVFFTAEAALKAMSSAAPELLVVDLRLPGMGGVEFIELLKKRFPASLILVLTMYEESDLIFDALKAGAAGYLLKRSSPEELCDAIRQMHRGGAPMSPSIARKVVDSFRAAPLRPEQTPAVSLSPREQEILGLLAHGAPYKKIADVLGISIETVRTHLRRVYEKLHVHSGAEAVMKYFGQGR